MTFPTCVLDCSPMKHNMFIIDHGFAFIRNKALIKTGKTYTLIKSYEYVEFHLQEIHLHQFEIQMIHRMS